MEGKKESVPARVHCRHLFVLLLVMSMDQINGNRAEVEELHTVMEEYIDDLLPKDNLTSDPVDYFLQLIPPLSPCRSYSRERERSYSRSRTDPSLADGYTYHSKSWPRLGQHVPRTMPSKYQNQLFTNYRIKEGLILVATLIVATFAYRFKGFMYLN